MITNSCSRLIFVTRSNYYYYYYYQHYYYYYLVVAIFVKFLCQDFCISLIIFPRHSKHDINCFGTNVLKMTYLSLFLTSPLLTSMGFPEVARKWAPK